MLIGLLGALVCHHLPASLTFKLEPSTVVLGQIGSGMLSLFCPQ